MNSVQVTNIVVKNFRIICTVKLNSIKFSNDKIKAALLKEMPRLALHKCKNLTGSTFDEVMGSTSLAHVLEHMIIDIQSNYTDEVLLGTTEWIYEYSGIAKIELSYTDDLVCLSAIKEAVDKLNNIIQYI